MTLSVFLTDTGEILDSDILFNGDDFKWSTGHSAGGGHDVQNAATHEIGHFLGISHSVRVPDSTMYPGTSAGELNKRTLHADDIAAVKELYVAGPSEALAITHDPGPGAEFPEPPLSGNPLASSTGPSHGGDARAPSAPAAGEEEEEAVPGDVYAPSIGVPAEPDIDVFSAGCSMTTGPGRTPESGRTSGSMALMVLGAFSLGRARRRREGQPSEEDQP